MKLKTPYSSYSINNLPAGCKYCVKGEKLVLFISGKCSRNCYYCSLSKKRKNKDIIWANERICSSQNQAIQEAIESNATSAGITGGDPLLFLNRTLKYAKALKNRFGKRFHIHIYLPTMYLTQAKLKKLSRYIDEIRFHPKFMLDSKSINLDINKIKLANKFYKKQNIGIELPLIPDKKQEILNFIIKISPFVGFVNLNEFELSETNYKLLTTNYILNEGGYTIKDSINSGLWILKQLKKQRIKINAHLCTADLKNNYQFKNRLKLHNAMKLSKRTKEGLVQYLATPRLKKTLNYLKNYSKNNYCLDKSKNYIILSEDLAKELLGKFKIFFIEEFPTFDRIEIEKQEIKI